MTEATLAPFMPLPAAPARRDGRCLARGALLAIALAYLALFLFVPLAAVFAEGLRKGWHAYAAAIAHPDALAAVRLTLLAAAIAVPLNLVFGVAAAYAIAKFQFPGRSALVSLIDLPFSVSPVVSGLVFVLLFGLQGLLGPWLDAQGWKVVFAVPGIVLATVFVTVPFVARELIALMQAQGREEEEAAVLLGAGGWQLLWRVTLPNVKWGLLYGVILCNARAMGEFGAVSVVSGHVRGLTNTLLRVIAGLERPDAGRVLVDGEETTHKPVQQRNVGFVFQHYALFRHMTIFENVAFGLRVRPRAQRPAEAAIREKVHELLRLVQLEGLAARHPHQLSGGQRQRIALARALAIEPRVLLLDEPFGALDAKVRRELRRWLRRLHDEIALTSVFVTHDQEEALEVADRIVVVNRGRIEQEGAPGEVYDHPATPFVYEFLGNVNLFEGRVSRGIAQVSGRRLAAPEHVDVRDALATAYVRPHEIDVDVRASGAAVAATVDHAVALGSVVRLELSCRDKPQVVEVELPRDRFEGLNIATGNLVYLTPRRARFFLNPASEDAVTAP